MRQLKTTSTAPMWGLHDKSIEQCRSRAFSVCELLIQEDAHSLLLGRLP